MHTSDSGTPIHHNANLLIETIIDKVLIKIGKKDNQQLYIFHPTPPGGILEEAWWLAPTC